MHAKRAPRPRACPAFAAAVALTLQGMPSALAAAPETPPTAAPGTAAPDTAVPDSPPAASKSPNAAPSTVADAPADDVGDPETSPSSTDPVATERPTAMDAEPSIADATSGGAGSTVEVTLEPSREVETTESSAATDQLEGASLAEDPLPEGVPETLPRLQRAGWWSVFGGVTLATAGGIFAGLAEREQNEASNLATVFDPESGSRLIFEDVQSEYEDHVRRGNAFAWTSRGFLIVGGAGIITGIVLFALQKKRGTPEQARLRWRGGQRLEVAF